MARRKRPAAAPSPHADDSKKLQDESAAEEAGFVPRTLDRSVIAIPLLRDLDKERSEGKRALHPVVIDVHLEFPGGRDGARARVREYAADLGRPITFRHTTQYLFAKL